MGHSVSKHLGMHADDYDRVIKTFIPNYEKMLATIGEWLKLQVPPDGRVIDLGGGTGALAQRVLTRLPRMRLELWDVDPKMLEVARHRLAPFGSRVSLVERSFTEELPSCNAVVASLALHHISDLAAKRKVYANIHDALRPSGIFLNGDAAVSAAGPEHDGVFRLWEEFMMSHGMSHEEAQKRFSDWAHEDTYYSLPEELTALAHAGFRSPECFWKDGPIAVYGGIKAADEA